MKKNLRYKWREICIHLVSCLFFLIFTVSPGFAATKVDLQIMILADVSRSVDVKEYVLQRDGYASIFSSPAFYNDYLVKNRIKTVAVTLVYWSSPKFIKTTVPWTMVDSIDSSKSFGAAVIKASPLDTPFLENGRPFDGTTAPGSAIAFGVQSFADSLYEGDRKIMIVSGDGIENDGIDTKRARDEALAKGITEISVIAIGSEALKGWFSTHVQGGTNSSTLWSKNYQELPEAIQNIFQRSLLATP